MMVGWNQCLPTLFPNENKHFTRTKPVYFTRILFRHCTNFLLNIITSAVQTLIQKHSSKGKIKVKLSLSTPWSHILGTVVQIWSFLTMVLDRGEWWKSCHNHITPHTRKRTTEEENLLHLLGFELDCPACSQVTVLTTLYWLHNKSSMLI